MPAGAVSTCDGDVPVSASACVRAEACGSVRKRAEACEAPRLIEKPWPQPGQRVELAAVEELPAALQARLLRARQARALQVGGEPQVVGCARADADSHARPVDIGHRLQVAVGKHHVGCLNFCIRCRERNRLGTFGLSANQADVPLVAVRGVAEQSRVGVWHQLQRYSNLSCQRCRHVGRHANGLTVWTTRRDEEEVGQVYASPQDASGRERSAEGGADRHGRGTSSTRVRARRRARRRARSARRSRVRPGVPVQREIIFEG